MIMGDIMRYSEKDEEFGPKGGTIIMNHLGGGGFKLGSETHLD